jgi:hypothetical protein
VWRFSHNLAEPKLQDRGTLPLALYTSNSRSGHRALGTCIGTARGEKRALAPGRFGAGGGHGLAYAAIVALSLIQNSA